MPYRDHVDAGYRLVAKGCKKARVKAVRGDLTDNQQILRSIWDELGHCSYITVDLTDFKIQMSAGAWDRRHSRPPNNT